MNKVIITFVCLFGLVASLNAASVDTFNPANWNMSLGGVNKVSDDASTTSLFNAKEFGFSLSTGYVLERSSMFKDPYSVNTTVGALWFPYRNFGIEVNVPVYQSKSVSVSEVQAGFLTRIPLAYNTPVLRSIAPYIGAGGVYNWNLDANWAYIAKVGVDIRFNKKWGVFIEGQYRNDTVKYWDKGQTSLQGGLKFVF